MSSKPIAERVGALAALISALVEWQNEYTIDQPQLDTQRQVDAALVFLGWKETKS